MNVIRNEKNTSFRGRRRARGRGRCERVIDILPKYQLDSGTRRPLVSLCPLNNTTTSTKTPSHFRRARGTSTSSFLLSSNRRGNSDSRTSGGSSTTDSCIILAITSGRGEARGEVGIAAIDVHHSHLILCQMSDCQTYMNTLTRIYIFDPIEILIPDTICNQTRNRNKLYSSIRDKFPNLTITPVSRIHFNECTGLERVKTHCAKEYATVELFVNQKYYALAATAALLKYIEFIQHIVYAPKSIRIEYQGSPNTTVIDMESAQSLELVTSQCGQPNISLFGSMDRCVTPMGRRHLRASILQPPCDERLITERQHCVAELVTNHSLRVTMQPFVRQLYGADRLLTLSMMSSQNNSVQNAERNLNYVLLLKNSLDIVPELRQALNSANASFFKKVQENLDKPPLKIMKEKILEIIHPDARSLMGYTSSNVQRCFAIKAGINDLLDIARQTYCELISDMRSLVESLAIKHKLNLSLECNATLGFHIVAEVPRQSNFQASDLPAEFVQVQKNRNTFSMTTNTLLVLSHQCKVACEELHVMSNVILNDLLVNIREHIGCLYQLSTDVAELDLIISLAQVSSSPEYVRPKFGGRLEIIDSLHPIMEVFGNERPVPNDVKASIPYNFHTILGPNMSGKSIYLKQIVLLHIMAQIGSYVPAKEAQFRITDRISCRICFRDDIECNASTFVLEMKEVQYILQSITPKSLVILDELCRGTTVEEGSSIAWAICERLLITTAFTFSATHFRYLTKLADLYYNVINHCFQTETKLTDGLKEPRLIYTHKLTVGIAPVDNYGIALAEVSGLPHSITVKARQYAANEETTLTQAELGYFMEPKSWEKTCYDRVAQMYKLMEDNRFNRRNIVAIIHDLDICKNDDVRRIEEEDRELCKALESFESSCNAAAEITSSSSNKANESEIQTVDYLTDQNTNFEVEKLQKCKNMRVSTDSIRFSDNYRQTKQVVDNSKSWLIDKNDKLNNNTQETKVTIPITGEYKFYRVNKSKRRVTGFLTKPTRSFDHELIKENSFTVPKNVGHFFSPPTIAKESKEIPSAKTATVNTSFSSTRSTRISGLHEYCLCDENFEPSLNSSILTETAVMTARQREANIFREIEGSDFDETLFFDRMNRSMTINFDEDNNQS